MHILKVRIQLGRAVSGFGPGFSEVRRGVLDPPQPGEVRLAESSEGWEARRGVAF